MQANCQLSNFRQNEGLWRDIELLWKSLLDSILLTKERSHSQNMFTLRRTEAYYKWKKQSISTKDSLAPFKIETSYSPTCFFFRDCKRFFPFPAPHWVFNLEWTSCSEENSLTSPSSLLKPEVIKAKSLSSREELKVLTFERKMSVSAFAP